jgi:hypothetical protein
MRGIAGFESRLEMPLPDMLNIAVRRQRTHIAATQHWQFLPRIGAPPIAENAIHDFVDVSRLDHDSRTSKLRFGVVHRKMLRHPIAAEFSGQFRVPVRGRSEGLRRRAVVTNYRPSLPHREIDWARLLNGDRNLHVVLIRARTPILISQVVDSAGY